MPKTVGRCGGFHSFPSRRPQREADSQQIGFPRFVCGRGQGPIFPFGLTLLPGRAEKVGAGSLAWLPPLHASRRQILSLGGAI